MDPLVQKYIDEQAAAAEAVRAAEVPPHPYPRLANRASRVPTSPPPTGTPYDLLTGIRDLVSPRNVRTLEDWENTHRQAMLLEKIRPIAERARNLGLAHQDAFRQAFGQSPRDLALMEAPEIRPYRSSILPPWSTGGQAFDWMESIGGTFGNTAQAVSGDILDAAGLPNYAHDNRGQLWREAGNSFDSLLFGLPAGLMDRFDPAADGSSSQLPYRAYRDQAEAWRSGGDQIQAMAAPHNRKGSIYSSIKESGAVDGLPNWAQEAIAITGGALSDNFPGFSAARRGAGAIGRSLLGDVAAGVAVQKPLEYVIPLTQPAGQMERMSTQEYLLKPLLDPRPQNPFTDLR